VRKKQKAKLSPVKIMFIDVYWLNPRISVVGTDVLLDFFFQAAWRKLERLRLCHVNSAQGTNKCT